jgi:hypothetical protein
MVTSPIRFTLKDINKYNVSSRVRAQLRHHSNSSPLIESLTDVAHADNFRSANIFLDIWFFRKVYCFPTNLQHPIILKIMVRLHSLIKQIE